MSSNAISDNSQVISPILSHLRDSLKQVQLDGLWVSDAANVQALTGFSHGEDAKVLVTQSEAWLYTDGRYIVQARDESQIPQYIARPPATYQHAAEFVAGKKIGIEGHSLTVDNLETLKEQWKADLIISNNLVAKLRLCKSDAELQAISEAQQLADRVFAEVRPMIQAGVRELDIANEIESRLRQAGAESAFEIIVASGPRGAMPHGVASQRIIQNDELVTVDMGAKLNSYCSDMTRTVTVGKPNAELARIYMAVLEAEESAIKAIRAGMAASDLDKVARDILEKHELAQYFSHSLGHGVGLEVHEGPRLSHNSTDILQAGMVITVEPGVYVPDVGGVRIEDLVLVTEDGYQVLSSAAKEHLEL